MLNVAAVVVVVGGRETGSVIVVGGKASGSVMVVVGGGGLKGASATLWAGGGLKGASATLLGSGLAWATNRFIDVGGTRPEHIRGEWVCTLRNSPLHPSRWLLVTLVNCCWTTLKVNWTVAQGGRVESPRDVVHLAHPQSVASSW